MPQTHRAVRHEHLAPRRATKSRRPDSTPSEMSHPASSALTKDRRYSPSAQVATPAPPPAQPAPVWTVAAQQPAAATKNPRSAQKSAGASFDRLFQEKSEKSLYSSHFRGNQQPIGPACPPHQPRQPHLHIGRFASKRFPK